MGLITGIGRQFRPPVTTAEPVEISSTAPEGLADPIVDDEKTNIEVDDFEKPEHRQDVESGVARVEAAQAVWGKYGKLIVIAGIAMIMVCYELDNTTVYVYQTYATSSFDKLSYLASLGTAGVIIFAVVKPPIAKISNIIGRGETYCLTISCYVLSYILCATAKSINAYAAGYVFYCIGQSGTNIMNDIIISDITTARWRALAIELSFFPFLYTPWVAAFIIDSVVGGIGWRWGIGMFAILMPFGASFIITTLLYFQHKAKKAGIVTRQKMTVFEFCSQIDLGGTILFTAGFAMLLLPMTFASGTASRWRTPWIIALITVGSILLLILPFYEKFYAKHPLVPMHYFKNLSIVTAVLLIATDSLGFAVTHTYMYPWSTIARGLAPRNATFLQTTNGVVQCLAGIVGGIVMLKTRRYKWLIMCAVAVRLVGYGVMIRLRGAENPLSELFIVQAVQGLGSGMIATATLVSAQIQVKHSGMAQITALVICCSFLGSSIGASIAGGIYTNTFKSELKRELGDGANEVLIETLYNSITGVIPVWGSPERHAINEAYSNVLRYMTYTALGTSVPSFILCWFMPDLVLPDQNNLVDY